MFLTVVIILEGHTEISGPWTQVLYTGLWSLDFEHWSLDTGVWKLWFGRWSLDAGLWTLDTVFDWFRTESELKF